MTSRLTKKVAAKAKDEEFILMRRTRAMLNDMWDHWRDTLGHTPDTAKRMMTAAIDEMHKTEMAALKKVAAKKPAVKKLVKKSVKKILSPRSTKAKKTRIG